MDGNDLTGISLLQLMRDRLVYYSQKNTDINLFEAHSIITPSSNDEDDDENIYNGILK